MSWLSSVSKAVGGVTQDLFGGGQTTTNSVDVQKPSQQEEDLLKGLIDQSQSSNSPTAGSEKDLTEAFKGALATYLANQGGQVSPGLLQQATDYVDQTFTNPAMASFDQFSRQYEARQNEQAATLGRSPMDSSIQQQNFRTLGDINANIGAQRGSMIAQRANQMPAQNLQFINSLNQQAFQNRVGLMNLQSGLYSGMQNYRLATANRASNNVQPKGIIGGIAAGLQAANSGYQASQALQGGGGGGGGGMPGPQYNLGNFGSQLGQGGGGLNAFNSSIGNANDPFSGGGALFAGG